MRTIFATVSILAWALWFGALVSLFLFAPTLFAHGQGTSASTLFQAFERYQLILAAVAIVATIAWRAVDPVRAIVVLFVLVLLAGLGGTASSLLITHKMEALRLAGEAHSPRFKQLHGYSMIVYTVEAVLLLVWGIVLPAAMRRRAQVITH